MSNDRLMVVSLDCHIDAESPGTFEHLVEGRGLLQASMESRELGRLVASV